jgi:hypothetical protein
MALLSSRAHFLPQILASVGKGGSDDKVDEKSGEVRSRKSNWVRIWKVVAFLASIGIIVYVSLVWVHFGDIVIMLLVLCTTSWGLLNVSPCLPLEKSLRFPLEKSSRFWLEKSEFLWAVLAKCKPRSPTL